MNAEPIDELARRRKQKEIEQQEREWQEWAARLVLTADGRVVQR